MVIGGCFGVGHRGAGGGADRHSTGGRGGQRGDGGTASGTLALIKRSGTARTKWARRWMARVIQEMAVHSACRCIRGPLRAGMDAGTRCVQRNH